LYAKSVDGLKFINNSLIRSTAIKPFHKRMAGITLDACKNVFISGNHIKGDVLGKDILLENMSRKNLKLDRGSWFKPIQ